MHRSMLFIPGNTPNLIVNGDCLGADAVILDLEDAVSPSEKDSARILVRNALRYMDFGVCEVIVRINSIDTDYWLRDLGEIMPLKPDMVLLPKTNCADDVMTADAVMLEAERHLGFTENTVRLMPLIETALGVENAFTIASASPRVAALFLGAEDLTADLQSRRTKAGREIDYARCRLVTAARAAGVDAIDTPFTDVNDDDGLRADAEYARALGFTGKSAISPRHITEINKVFSPSRKDIDYAYEVMDAIRAAQEQGRGAIALHGKMVDAPVVVRAQRTIAVAEEISAGRGVSYEN